MNYTVVHELSREMSQIIKTRFKNVYEEEVIIDFFQEDLIPDWINEELCTEEEANEALNLVMEKIV